MAQETALQVIELQQLPMQQVSQQSFERRRTH